MNLVERCWTPLRCISHTDRAIRVLKVYESCPGRRENDGKVKPT